MSPEKSMSFTRKFNDLFPERPKQPVAPKIIGKQTFKHGERWSVEYSASRGERVCAYVLIPKKTGNPLPAILASHQHNGQYHLGKSETAGLAGNPEMAYGAELCARGYVVICPDHPGFEDRQDRPGRGRTTLSGKEYEIFMFGDAILRGSSLAAVCLFDLQQALEVLIDFDFVDSKRLGVIGHSMGGLTALWLAAADSRISVGFSSCGFSTMAAIQKMQRPHNCAIYVPNLLKSGDMDDVAASISPRAFGMSNGMLDVSFPMEGVRKIHRRVKSAIPKEKRLLIAFRNGHLFPPEIRSRAYKFMDKQLNHQPLPQVRVK